MLEVEVKARVQDAKHLREGLLKKGVTLSEAHTQADHVFVKSADSIDSFYKNSIFVRIREEDNKEAVLTLKKKRQDLASLEYETAVDSVEMTTQILSELELVHALTIEKKRSTGTYQQYTICLDEVTNLGVFIEVESLVDTGDIDSIQAEMFTFLQSVGILAEDRVTDAYDTLLLKKRFNETSI